MLRWVSTMTYFILVTSSNLDFKLKMPDIFFLYNLLFFSAPTQSGHLIFVKRVKSDVIKTEYQSKGLVGTDKHTVHKAAAERHLHTKSSFWAVWGKPLYTKSWPWELSSPPCTVLMRTWPPYLHFLHLPKAWSTCWINMIHTLISWSCSGNICRSCHCHSWHC